MTTHDRKLMLKDKRYRTSLLLRSGSGDRISDEFHVNVDLNDMVRVLFLIVESLLGKIWMSNWKSICTLSATLSDLFMRSRVCVCEVCCQNMASANEVDPINVIHSLTTMAFHFTLLWESVLVKKKKNKLNHFELSTLTLHLLSCWL